VSCAYWRYHPELFYTSVNASYDTWICNRFLSNAVDFGPMNYLNTSLDSTDSMHWLKLYCPYIAITAAMQFSEFNPCSLTGFLYFESNTTSWCYYFARRVLQSAYPIIDGRIFPYCSKPRPQFSELVYRDDFEEVTQFCYDVLVDFINDHRESNIELRNETSGEPFGNTTLISAASVLSIF